MVYQAPQERNYHIFYELCAGLSGPLRSTSLSLSLSPFPPSPSFPLLFFFVYFVISDALHIGPAEEYRYLNQGKTMTIEGVSDTSQFEITKVISPPPPPSPPLFTIFFFFLSLLSSSSSLSSPSFYFVS